MNRADFLQAVTLAKGQYAAAEWESVVKTAAPYKAHDVRKRVRATVRTGVAYANLAQNEGRDTGPLPWGEWDLFPWVIVHNGADYFRLYRSEGHAIEVTYTIDGVPATRDEVDAMLTPSARKRSEGPVLTFTVKAENLISIS